MFKFFHETGEEKPDFLTSEIILLFTDGDFRMSVLCGDDYFYLQENTSSKKSYKLNILV